MNTLTVYLPDLGVMEAILGTLVSLGSLMLIRSVLKVLR